ncbi:Sec-independent protein translocase subunit TatA [Pseudonocardia endophytica]|uniref:Sec-independent protein translocase protein TatA n=1 Tax=Pseudonocardia endophytica TaxID=401976 RepID=A0A4R1HT32_PSEEN|nr:Sec-independent protein translocase subunit TatA [Pseudonocardia endophytica]TCK25817.1 sec-independent protein translocase protein TatA [Pseudonocardia endophytica]
MGAMSPTHWLIVIGVLVLLFGAKKLPQMARSVGQSARVFKGEMKGLRDDEEKTEQPEQAEPAAPAQVEAAPAPAAAPVTERPAA